MGSLILGFLLLIAGFCSIGASVWEQNQEIKLNRKLIDALYGQLGYKYSTEDYSSKTLFDDGSWLTNLKSITIGNKSYYLPSKTILERLDELENNPKPSIVKESGKK